MTEFEKRREVLRQDRARFCWINIIFIYILLILTERTVTYICLRLTSKEKIFEWVSLIPPKVFYRTFVTNMLIIFGVFFFVISSTRL